MTLEEFLGAEPELVRLRKEMRFDRSPAMRRRAGRACRGQRLRRFEPWLVIEMFALADEDLLRRELAKRRTRRALYPEVAYAFWPDDLPPAALASDSELRAWWSQRTSDDDGRLTAAAGEIVDR